MRNSFGHTLLASPVRPVKQHRFDDLFLPYTRLSVAHHHTGQGYDQIAHHEILDLVHARFVRALLAI